MHLDLSNEFNLLVELSHKKLLQSPVTQINYTTRSTKESYIDNIKKLNYLLIDGANIYALWVKKDGSKTWQLMYIGQRKSVYIRSRLIQHFFKKAEKTGSQLNNILHSLHEGSLVGVTAIHVKPDELRMAVEERLISMMKKKNLCTWNIHS